jgi:hypothetical protein
LAKHVYTPIGKYKSLLQIIGFAHKDLRVLAYRCDKIINPAFSEGGRDNLIRMGLPKQVPAHFYAVFSLFRNRRALRSADKVRCSTRATTLRTTLQR